MSIFKQCTCFDTAWACRDEFLDDGRIELVGYQANFVHLELGYLLFNHLNCESTIAIHAGLFKDLYAGPIFARRLTGTESCQGFCTDTKKLEACDEQCECAYVRNILQIISNWSEASQQVALTAG